MGAAALTAGYHVTLDPSASAPPIIAASSSPAAPPLPPSGFQQQQQQAVAAHKHEAQQQAQNGENLNFLNAKELKNLPNFLRRISARPTTAATGREWRQRLSSAERSVHIGGRRRTATTQQQRSDKSGNAWRRNCCRQFAAGRATRDCGCHQWRP